MSKLSGQGNDNWVFMFENAKYLALAGEYDEAITQLEQAIDRGYGGYGLFTTVTPMFEPVKNDPRFMAVEAVMVENINVQRQQLGLEPVNPFSRL